MKVLITGADGFVGKNLRLALSVRNDVEVGCYTQDNQISQLSGMLTDVDFVFHLAGVNRPLNPQEFVSGNQDLTRSLCVEIAKTARKIPVVFASSVQAAQNNPYGLSKRAAEDSVFALARERGIAMHVFRLPNIFGKWCKPNYNSAVATFCHNIAHGLPIQINDPSTPLTLLYVDDLIERFVQLLNGADSNVDLNGFELVAPQYSTTVGAVADQLHRFHASRSTLTTERVGAGLTRALYSTYVSSLPTDKFAYDVPRHGDPRGVFVEMLKTPDCGQFSYFTAHPGITRGGHYHHSKTEKFLVITGRARFKFRHMHTGETHELITSGDKAQIVETVPGWTHDITNIGAEEMVVMLWANEIFDQAKPDTFACPL